MPSRPLFSSFSPVSSPRQAVALLLLGGLLGRGLVATWLPPGFDEAYYYQYSQHLAWSYFDHPLLVALTTGVGPWLTGQVTPLTLRLGSLLLYTVSVALMMATGRRLWGPAAGWWTGVVVSLSPLLGLGFGTLTLPDSPLICCWSAVLWLASREFFADGSPIQSLNPGAIAPATRPENIPVTSPATLPETLPTPPPYRPTYRLALIGLGIGLACLSKYHGALLGTGLVGFSLTSSRHHRLWRSPWWMISLGLLTLVISPLVLWNQQHDWVSLRAQSGRAVPTGGYRWGDLLVVWLAGVGYLLPTVGLPLWISLVQTLRRSMRGGTPEALILWVSLPPMLLFTLMGGYRQVLPTWPAPGFWGATLLLGAAIAHWSRRTQRYWLWSSLGTVAVLIPVALLHINQGLLQKPGGLGLVPATQDASAEMMDIGQMQQLWRRSPEIQAIWPDIDFVFTREIFLAGQVGMAIAPLPARPITCFSQDLRGFAFWSKPQDWVGKNGLYVVSDRLSPPTGLAPDPKTDATADAAATIPSFAPDPQPEFRQWEKVTELAWTRAGVPIQRWQIYRAIQLQQPYPRPSTLIPLQ
jgi:4-amino-4-deoxy-L-arabinose transferase-like glycosyltransferase